MQNGFLLVHQWFLGDSFMYSTAIIFISFFYGYGKRSKVFQCSHIIHEKKHFESLLIKQKSLHVQSWFFQDFLSWLWLCIPVGVVLIMNLLTYFFFSQNVSLDGAERSPGSCIAFVSARSYTRLLRNNRRFTERKSRVIEQ